MKTRKTQTESGSALAAVMIIAIVSSVIMATFFKLTTSQMRSTQRYAVHKKAMAAAEAGLDKAVLELRNLTTDNQLNSVSSISTPPSINGFNFRDPKGQKRFQVEEVGELREKEEITEGRYAGLTGDIRTFRVEVGVTGTNDKQGVVLSRKLQLLRIPLFQFGVFYEEDLEIHPGPPMVFAGPIHTNGNLFIGANNRADFLDQITVRKAVHRYRKNNHSYQSGDARIADDNGDLTSMRVNGDYLEHSDSNWGIKALQRWGGNLADSAHGVPYLSLPIPVGNEAYSIIDRKKESDEDGYNPDLEDDKFENKADLLIWRNSSGGLEAELADGTNFPLTYTDENDTTHHVVGTSSFLDYREGDGSGKQMESLDINLEALKNHPFFDNDVTDLPDDDFGYLDNTSYVLKEGGGGGDTGNYNPISLSNSRGANVYGNDFKNGYNGDISIGDIIDTEPGNMKGDTQDAVDHRIANDQKTVVCPVVQAEDLHGRSSVTVIGFAKFELTEVDNKGEVTATYKGPVEEPETVVPIGVFRKASGETPETEVFEYNDQGLIVYTYTDYPNDSKTTTDSEGCVRLKNGEELLTGGFTVASPQPVYIEGDYNTLDKKPALVAGDAVNILSNNWDDANDNWQDRNATDTTVNLCMMNGNTETIEYGNYNGGLENLPRMLEKWSGNTLTIRGSIFCLWQSKKATGEWNYGGPRYTAPRRDWEYDEMYRNPDNAPPGMPPVYALETLDWEQSNWNSQTAAANTDAN